MMNKETICCPICNAKLTPVGGFWTCPNDHHRTWAGTEGLWQALIQSQKDLADMKEQAEFNAIMRGKDDADEIFGLKEQIEICNKREYKLTEQIAILKQDLETARQALMDIFLICEQDASKDANTRISEIYAITKKVLEHKE